ncbi:hypothetical protein LCGC14_0389690 [marine sediment metagenome]|uniref:Uncharacterized protein n=1 Tax=marine sediment metagenome TaxID=412755 RepID=A0A0F9TI06_9ZZZZ
MARLEGNAPNLDIMQRALIGTPRLIVDEEVNDSDKTFIVPATYQWRIQHIWVEFTAAGASDRQLEVQIQDLAGDVIGVVRAGKEQATGNTKKYMFAPGLTRLTAFYDTDYLTVPLPENWVLLGGWGIRIFDNNAQAAGADDMVIQMLVMEMDTVSPRPGQDPTRRRDFGTTIPHIQLRLSSTAPKIGVFPVITPGAEQLTLTTTAPTVGPTPTVPRRELVLSTTAPARVTNFNRQPAGEQLTVTFTAPSVVQDTPFAPPAEQLTFTFSAPTRGIFPVIFPGAAQLRIAPATPSAVVDTALEVPYAELAITSTTPVIGIFPVLEPGAEQLTITPTAPTVVAT